MTEITITQDAPVLVAIDIAKTRHEVLVAVPDKKRRRRLTVLKQLTDFNRLIAALKEYGRPVRVWERAINLPKPARSQRSAPRVSQHQAGE